MTLLMAQVHTCQLRAEQHWGEKKKILRQNLWILCVTVCMAEATTVGLGQECREKCSALEAHMSLLNSSGRQRKWEKSSVYLGSSLKDEVTVGGWTRGRRAETYNLWTDMQECWWLRIWMWNWEATPTPRKAYKLVIVWTVKNVILYFDLFIFNFYWGEVALWCCISLWCTAKWLRYTEIKPVIPKRNNPATHWKDWCKSWSSNT